MPGGIDIQKMRRHVWSFTPSNAAGDMEPVIAATR